jgi:hypothetical protein
MGGPLVGTLVLLAFAPAPEPSAAPGEPAPANAPASAPQRGYEGQIDVAADESAVEPEPVSPDAPPKPDAPVTTLPVEPTQPAVPAEPTWVAPKKRDVPRVLATIDGYGYPEREIAVIGRKKVKFTPGVQVRNQVGFVSPFTLDRFGNKYEEGGMTTGRIRWNPTLAVGKKFKLVGMIDLANGRWAPDGARTQEIDRIIEEDPGETATGMDRTVGQPPPRSRLTLVDPRELYIEGRFSFGLVRIGQQAFTWGQGMLANGGNSVDRFGDMRFGDDGPGDIYERFLFATKPFQYRPGNIKHLAIAIGADLVFRDERVDLLKKDLAGQALIVLRWQNDKNPGNWIGGYGVYRNQTNAGDGDVYPNDNKLEVGAFDISGQGTKYLRDDLQLIGAFETALIFGRTTNARDENGGHKVLQGGAVARGYVGNHEKWLVGFDAGYASGDPNPNDRWINNFVFDAGHTVGLILFPQVNAWRTAQTEILATDGELSGQPLNGTQFLPTRGGVTNALYIHPKARYALWERLEIWGGPLIAVAPVPIVDPYTTRLAGGVPTNSAGGDGDRRYYGTELDLGIRGRIDLRNFWLMAGLQGGVLLPGKGLANRGGNTDKAVGAIWFRTEIRY